MNGAGICVLMTMVAGPSTPSANSTIDTEIALAIADYEAIEFAEVIPRLKRVLKHKQLSDQQRANSLAYLARAHAVMRHRNKAMTRFMELLELRPYFDIPSIESPLIQRAFAAARVKLEGRSKKGKGPDSPQGGATALSAGPAPSPPSATSPSPFDPSLEESRREQQDGGFWRSPWPWVAGGAVVAVASTVTILVWRPWEQQTPPTTFSWQLQ